MRTACEFQVPWMAVNFKIPVLISKMNIFCIVLLVLVDIYGCYGAKLSVPRILLPFNTGVPTNYTLEVKEGGCYKWSSSRHDLVTVTPLPNERERASCTTKALVSAISRYSERENAIILAEDEKSSQVLRCDVVIDSIHSIEIITTTRVLFLEDAPEAFEVVAKNGQGDQFSSLAGVAFQWSLESDSLVNDAYGVLRFLKFADSAYKTPTTIEYWEKQNLHGSVILMEGSKTGSAKVSVKPLDSAYKNVASYEVSLVVVANLNLKPAHIYVLPGSKVKYNLELIKQGKAFPISLPSEQYYLEVVNQNIVSLDGSVVTALTYGTSNIVVKDKYVTARELAYLPSAVIHVAHPSYLTLSVSPGEKWTLEENKDYSVSVALYDRNSHPIHIDKDMRVSVVFPSKYFQVKKSSVNGTFHEIKTLSPGSCEIKAQLLGIANQDGSIRSIEGLITHTQDVIIYESIKVHPAQTLLPWDPVSEPSYSVLLKATGGTGTYNWKSGDSSLASVNAFYEEEETIARVTTFGQGSFKVYATDAHIPSFSGSGDVSVLPVVDLEILPDKIEVELNDTLVLPVSMFGLMPDNSAKRFSNCSEIPIIVDIDEIQKFSLTTDVTSMPKPPACRNIHLTCVSKGFNRIRVKYQREDLSLKKAVIAACYRKLKVMKPGNEVVLAVGSSYEVLFEGGPRPWPRCPTHYINLVQKHKFLDVSVLRNSSDLSDTHKVPTFCKGYGENTLKLEVGNKPCDSNPHPAVSQSSIKVFCSVPESLTLKPVIQGKFASKEKISKKCPVTGDDRIAIHSARPLNIELIVKDSFGREFHNISSLDIQWTLSNPSLASLSNSAQISLNAQLKSRYYQELHPHGFEGILKVTASILGYQSNLQNVDGGINEEHFSINSSLNFLLVEEAIVQPKKLSVFNSPSNKVYFNVSKGSGHFQVEVSDGIKAKAVYLSATRQIEVTPQETGSITITLHDLCLGIIHESVAEIEIYGISAVVVHVVDKVQLGKSITAVVEVLNEDNEQIPASVFSLMNLQAVSQSDIISIRLASKPEPHQYQALYNINGVFLGQTSFKIITQANIFKGVRYSSESYPIQVFSPLRLNPRHVVLIVGGTFQVLCSGGPQPQTNIEYLLDDKEIAVVSVAGIVEAKKIGTTTLTARSVGVDRKDKAVVYSEDKIIVSCISLKEIKIHSPLSRMVAGAEMPLHAFGLTEDENPFAFGTAYPTAQFKWTVSNDKVASLYNMYSSIGLQESSENNFRVGIKAHQDGLVTVHLEVSLAKELSFFGSSRVLSSEIQIQVFKKLKLINPEVEDGMILMSLNSQLKLKCNRFGTAKVIYEILPSSGQEAPTVTSDGNLIASSKPGSAILLVTAVEDFDVTQRLSVIVRVEEVAYMMLKPVGKILTREWPLTVLPIGFTIPFHVSYHDNIGLPFDAVRSQLQFRASRHNSARVSFGTLNNTLSVQVVKPGFTVLKVWEKDMSIPPDYIKIGTGTAIDPADVHLTVGDVVCFGSPLVTQEGHGGSWASSKSVLAIHSLSGGAVALGPGQATVIYSLLNGFSTSSQVTIQDAAYISIEPSNVNQISNLPRIKPYKVYLVIQSNETHKDNNIVGKNCSHATESSMPLPLVQPPFSCELNFLSSSVDISVNDIFQSAGGFDIEKGMYYCSIEPVNKISASDASILEGQVSLTVHLDSMGQASSLSQQLLLSFMPAFYVQQDELVLSDVQNTNQLVISATPAVQRCIKVTPSDQTVLRVKSPVKNSVFPASVSFPVELHDINYLWKGDMSPLYLEISCPITKQLVKVPIKVKRLELSLDGTGYCAPPPLPAVTDFIYDWYLIAKVTVAVIVFILFIYIMRCFSSARRGVVTSQPVFLSSSSSFDGSKSFSPVHSPFRQRFSPSPTGEYENLSGPLRLCSLEATPPSVTRRRTENIFR